MAASILVVEDEDDIRELLCFTLTRAGFTPQPVASVEQAQQLLGTTLPDLAIIDWMLPGVNGVDFARQLRRDPLTESIPIIMLTARGEEADKLKSFESGVDDHVTKPFSPRELVARIKALLRRAGADPSELLEYDGLSLKRSSRRFTIEEQPVHLGPNEYRLLELFMQNPDRVFDRAQLLDRVWGRSLDVEERSVDVLVLRLRKLLQPFDKQHLIQTVRGVGYRFGA